MITPPRPSPHDGGEPPLAPPPARRRTPWTRLSRRLTAAFLVLLALVTVPSAIAYSTPAAMRTELLGTPAARSLTARQLAQTAAADSSVAIAVAVFLGLVYLAVALGALRGTRWSFWVALVLLALESVSAVTGLGGVLHPASSTVPRASLLVDWILSVIGLALFAGLLVTLVRAARHPAPGPP